ncbi:MAG: hypothetical protein AB1656_01090 [Candidatus Omnitrophota bacterium]
MGLTLSMAALLMLGGTFAQFSLSPADWFKSVKTEPKYQQIQFWDYQLEKQRGIRAFFYTLKLDDANKRVDWRLHEKMTQFLSAMCQEVVTLDAFDNPLQKAQAETVLASLADQWKMKSAINPSDFFDRIPSLDVDVLIFMERTFYDHEWKKDKKHLAIGVNVGAFEMDFGKPIYADRLRYEIPWTGEQISYAKAEHSALLQAADAIGEALHQGAEAINQYRDEELKAAELAKIARQKETLQQLKDETKQFKKLAQTADAILSAYKEPQEIIAPISTDLSSLKEMLKRPEESFAPQEAEVRKALAVNIHNNLQNLQTWLIEQENLRKKTELESPPPEAQQPVDLPPPELQETPPLAPPKEALIPASVIPDIAAPIGNIFDRRWLLPSAVKEEAGLEAKPLGETISPSTTDLIPAAAKPVISYTTPFVIPRLTLPDKPYAPLPTPIPKTNIPGWLGKIPSSALIKPNETKKP